MGLKGAGAPGFERIMCFPWLGGRDQGAVAWAAGSGLHRACLALRHILVQKWYFLSVFNLPPSVQGSPAFLGPHTLLLLLMASLWAQHSSPTLAFA